MLVSVKLLFSMLDHTAAGDDGHAEPDGTPLSAERGDAGPPVPDAVPDRPDDANTVPDVPDDHRPVPDVPDHRPLVPNQKPTVPDDARVPAVHRTTDASDVTRARPEAPGATLDPSRPTPRAVAVPGDRAAPLTGRSAVDDLIPAARTAHATLAGEGRPVSRDALAQALRRDGHALSNARASLLTKILKSERLSQ